MPAPAPGPVVADIGVKTFAQVNSTLSVLTGVPTTDPNVSATYQAVQQQLPATPTLEAFSSANQVGIAQLAVQYCNVMVNNPSYFAKRTAGRDLERHAVLLASRYRPGDRATGSPCAGRRTEERAAGIDHDGRVRRA